MTAAPSSRVLPDPARAAGMRTIGVLGTLPPKRLAMCERLVAGIDRGLIDQLIG